MANVPDGKVPIFESVGEAFRYLVENFQRWLPAIVVMGGISALIAFLSPQLLAPVSQIMTPANGLQSSLIATLASLVFTTGVLRHALNDDFQSPVGMTLGMPEVRIVLIALGLALIFGIIGFFVVFVLMIVLAGAAVQSEPDIEAMSPEDITALVEGMMQDGGGGLVLLLLLACVLAALFIYIRLLFVQAATVAEGRMMVFSTWNLSRGNWWRILACVLLTALPVSIVSDILFRVFEQGFLGGAEDVSDVRRLLFGFGIGAVSAVAVIPMTALVAYLYRGLRPSEPPEATFE